MKKSDIQVLFTILVLIFLFDNALAQNTFSGNKTLDSQASVVAFGANNYTGITGYLIIQGSDIYDLSSLSTISTIGDNLTITGNVILSNLSGLNGINSIGLTLIISNNSALLNLSDLSGITSVGDNIYISGNSVLTDLAGLNGITFVGGNISIITSPALMSISGLNGITTVGRNIEIVNNAALTEIIGLKNIQSVTGELEITYNATLINLDGLKQISSIGGNFNINNNAALTNLNIFSGLNIVGGYLHVYRNTILNSFCGLYNLLSTPAPNGLLGSYLVYGNTYNPSKAQIIVDGACPIKLNLKAFLEGAYNSNNMLTTLNASIPSNQPFTGDPWNYQGTETQNSIPIDVVDWVLIELRTDENTPSNLKRAAFLLENGDIVDIDGSNPVSFDAPSQEYFIVVYNRNHLPIMSNTKIEIN